MLTLSPVCVVSLGHKEPNVIVTLSCCFGISKLILYIRKKNL